MRRADADPPPAVVPGPRRRLNPDFDAAPTSLPPPPPPPPPSCRRFSEAVMYSARGGKSCLGVFGPVDEGEGLQSSSLIEEEREDRRDDGPGRTGGTRGAGTESWSRFFSSRSDPVVEASCSRPGCTDASCCGCAIAGEGGRDGGTPAAEVGACEATSPGIPPRILTRRRSRTRKPGGS